MSKLPSLCRCGHVYAMHEHYPSHGSTRTNCTICGVLCMRYRPQRWWQRRRK